MLALSDGSNTESALFAAWAPIVSQNDKMIAIVILNMAFPFIGFKLSD
ncbi:hypothetical protein [Burkholderia glumae]|nr:hypothetical protein [Burkholderia glumae]QJP72084.1 hypothetical protein HJC54_18180 [Burkholderia glumae]